GRSERVARFRPEPAAVLRRAEPVRQGVFRPDQSIHDRHAAAHQRRHPRPVLGTLTIALARAVCPWPETCCSSAAMKLIVQPDAGIVPVVSAITGARKSIDILIFRLDRMEIARALESAVARGVHVRALTAHQNRGGTKSLRKLEMHLLE